jgi:programmed cell death protein 5
MGPEEWLRMVDEDPELEALRQRRMAQLQAAQEQEAIYNKQNAEMEAQKRAVLRNVLTPEARERLATVRLAYPEVAASLENQLIALYQSGRLPGPVNDETMKKLLAQVQPKKREISIVRK